MSTILDALRKVERERPHSPREQLLELPRRHVARRPLSLSLVASFAALGFTAGIILALWRNTRPIQIGSFSLNQPVRPLPAPAVPPAVPPAAAPPAPAPPAVAQAPAPVPAPAAPPAAAPPDQVAAAAPQAAAPTQPASPPPAAQPAPPPAPAAIAPVPAAEPAMPGIPGDGGAVAAAPPPAGANPTGAGSALEPSPFTRQGVARAKPARPAPNDERHEQVPPANALAAIEPPAQPEAEAPAVEPEPAPAPSPEVVIDTGRSPPGAPKVALTFLQWSADPERRFAFVSIDGSAGQRIREGDGLAGMTVAQITPTGVEFRREGKLFIIRPRH